MCQHVDCLDTSSENHGMITILLDQLSSYNLSQESGRGGGIIIKFNQMFPYANYHFLFVLNPIFVLKFVFEILVYL